MLYKFYRYTITNNDRRLIGPNKHFDLFNRSTGSDEFGEHASYRGRKNAVLMYIQNYTPDFAGLVGRHATERVITKYDDKIDKTSEEEVADDDYPHAAFICFSRLGMLACVDGADVNATAAIQRLHAILSHRQNVQFVTEPLTETVDLRRAVKKFRIVKVEYEVLPVNPHTKDLGMQLDQNRALDHIKKMAGVLEGSKKEPLELNGGFLTQVQQLQESGHGRVGFVGLDERDTEIKVPKPKEARALPENEDLTAPGTSPEVKITLPGVRIKYPFSKAHVQYMKGIASMFAPDSENG